MVGQFDKIFRKRQRKSALHTQHTWLFVVAQSIPPLAATRLKWGYYCAYLDKSKQSAMAKYSYASKSKEELHKIAKEKALVQNFWRTHKALVTMYQNWYSIMSNAGKSLLQKIWKKQCQYMTYQFLMVFHVQN